MLREVVLFLSVVVDFGWSKKLEVRRQDGVFWWRGGYIYFADDVVNLRMAGDTTDVCFFRRSPAMCKLMNVADQDDLRASNVA